MHRFYRGPDDGGLRRGEPGLGRRFCRLSRADRGIPYHRLFNSPISEGAIVGAATGYALSGGRVVAELMYCDFMGRAGDEIFNQMAKWQSMSGGMLKMPLVLRVSVGAKYGAQHSQDWSAMWPICPGSRSSSPPRPTTPRA